MEPHWLEHALLAIPIGFGASLIYALLHYALPAAIYNYATVAWVGGVFYYLGREVRDAEKGTAADGFDYSGLGAPIVSCFLIFYGIAFAVASRYQTGTPGLYTKIEM